MKNLGKIILFCLISFPLWAEIKVSVDKDHITRGERVTLTLRVSGQGGEVKIPPFDELCGYTVEGRMQSRRDVFSNGIRTQEISLMYEFMPQRSCVIEPFRVSVNGKEEMTDPINITVSKVAISKNEAFLVELETDKTSVYVGEPFEMSVKLKERSNMNTLAESISLPENKNIWVKSEHKGSAFVQDEYSVRHNRYAMAAQQSGKLSLGPLRWDVKVRSQSKDYWNTWIASTKTRTVFSNELDIEVKPLPEDVHLVGEMSITAKVNKYEVNAGEAVNLTITVEGRANIEDVEVFDIHLPGAQAFKEEPTVKHYLQEGKYFGSFTQKVALVAERDFTIPAFELRYMDVKTDKVKTIKTKPIDVNVLNAPVVDNEEIKITRAEEKPQRTQEDTNLALTFVQGSLLLLGGFVLGLITAMIPWKRVLTHEKKKQTVSAKVSKEVLQILMSNMKRDTEIEEMATKLSENLYEGKSHDIDKKRLKEILKELQG